MKQIFRGKWTTKKNVFFSKSEYSSTSLPYIPFGIQDHPPMWADLVIQAHSVIQAIPVVKALPVLQSEPEYKMVYKGEIKRIFRFGKNLILN